MENIGSYGRSMSTFAASQPSLVAPAVALIDDYLPTYDVAITEHIVVDANLEQTYRATKDLDFLTVRSPLLTASMFVRGLPMRLRGHGSAPPLQLHLTGDNPELPGWLHLGDVQEREIVFGAIGQFWKADIEWKDVAPEQFASFCEPGWGKIACHLLLRADTPNRTVLTYECRTATTDPDSRRAMSRYWPWIRPFAGHIMRATLRTIRAAAEAQS
jgi:hypothetical protein